LVLRAHLCGGMVRRRAVGAFRIAIRHPPCDRATVVARVALLGLLVLVLWAVAPRLRAARWPGPIRALARTS
jgi:hypothetical protein